MILRVRTKAGTWRIDVEGPQTTVGAVKQLIEQQKNVQAAQQTLSKDPKGDKPLDDAATLQQCRLGDNGAMVHLIVGEAVALPPPPQKEDRGIKGAARVKIGADGKITATEYDDYCSSKGFRPGQAALGDIKKAWTLTDFLEMDDQFNFKIKRQGEGLLPRRVAGLERLRFFSGVRAAARLAAAARGVLIWLF